MTSPIKSTKNLGWVWDTQNPFLFCVHHLDKYPPGNANQGLDSHHFRGRQMGSDFNEKDGFRMYHGREVPGFPAHPHRGFETVTVVLDGFIDHTDSLGGAGRYGNGDVQWMTAGEGMQHCEMFPLVNEDEDNRTELFQIWLNLPKRNKFVEPCYKMLWNENVPVVDEVDEAGRKTTVRIVAGKIGESVGDEPAPNSWAADPDNEVAIYIINMEPNATWTLPHASEDINRSLYVYEGGPITISGKSVSLKKGVFLHPEVETTIEMGVLGGKVLVLQGKPIDEPVVQHGPFVMNSREEIMEAMMDYQRTQFGGWPFDRSDPVHPRDQGRFAKYSDGREEIRD